MDAILFWNAVALEANRVSHTDPARREQNGPTLSSRALAIVHLAMYDAHAALTGGVRYLPAPAAPGPGPGAPSDAIAGAAHATLSALFPSQKATFDAHLALFVTTQPPQGGSRFAFGAAVGRALVALRANDPDARDCGYVPSKLAGRHRVDPDNPAQGYHAPYYGMQSRCFAARGRHALLAPPFRLPGGALDPGYVDALRNVRAKGIRPDLTATLTPAPGAPARHRPRTPDETLIGIFWGYDGAAGLGTPPRLYNQIVRLVAQSVPNPATGALNTEAENAKLFALVNAAMGDAGILAWEQKYAHDFWRPVVGIREHDASLGPCATPGQACAPDGDPGWLPLGAPSTNAPVKNFTPNFPAYPSGHATFGAAALQVTRLFYGQGGHDDDELFEDLDLVSEEYDGRSRDNTGTVRPRHRRAFPEGLWSMIIENGLSRVFLGVHWVFDAFAVKEQLEEQDCGSLPIPDLSRKVGGVPLGLDIAEDVFATFNGEHGIADRAAPAKLKTPDCATTPMPTTPVQPLRTDVCDPFADECPQKGSSAKGSAPVGQQAWPSGLAPR